MENCVAHMKSVGSYGEAEAAAIEKFAEAFKKVNFPPGASVFYRQSPDGVLGVSICHQICYLIMLINDIFFFLLN